MLDAHRLWLQSGGKQGKRAVGKHDFSGKDLTGAQLSKAQLKKSDFTKANLKDANFKEAELRAAVFKGANLQNTLLQNSDLLEAEFSGATFTNANLQGATLRRANFDQAKLGGRTRLREADLRNANLEHALYLQTAQLAGADVGGAKLPDAIAEFEGLKTIAEATSNAQKLFVAMLGGCLYSWLTIGTTKDAALLTNSASSPLPIIGTALPIVGFYIVAPILLLALYFYFHLNMQRLWEALADLPAVFPDGRSLDKRADPWLLNGLVSAHFVRLRRDRPALSRLQQWLSILLAWWIVPITLFVFWARFLTRHDWLGTGVHIALLAITVTFAWISYRLARATLRDAPRKPFHWKEAWQDWRIFKRFAGIVVMWVVGVGFYLASFATIGGVPSYIKGANLATYDLRLIVPRALEIIRLTPFANLVEEDVSTKPPNWTGKSEQYALVKGARLVGARMEYAQASSVFLVNANLFRARLEGANISYANLSNASLMAADLSRAVLVETNLSNAQLQGADLSNAKLLGTGFSKATLTNANLSNANLEGANLSNADLSVANLSKADLWHANLFRTDLSNAKLSDTNLEGVDLRMAKGLTKSQVEKAITDEKTLLPADLPP